MSGYPEEAHGILQKEVGHFMTTTQYSICIYWTSCQDQRCIMLIDISSIYKACIINVIIIIGINTKTRTLFVFPFIFIFGKAKP